MELVAVVVAFGFSAWLAARAIYAHGRLAGLKEATTEVAGGVGTAYQRPGAPAPIGVRRCLALIDKKAVRAFGGSRNATAIALALRELGKEIGAAARQNGQTEGERAKHDEIRIDLPLRELLAVRWLAHAGFKLMMGNKAGGKFAFLDESDAQQSNFALDRLERCLSQEQAKDPTTPYALALDRQQMIWERWPQGIAAPETLRDAA